MTPRPRQRCLRGMKAPKAEVWITKYLGNLLPTSLPKTGGQLRGGRGLFTCALCPESAARGSQAGGTPLVSQVRTKVAFFDCQPPQVQC